MLYHKIIRENVGFALIQNCRATGVRGRTAVTTSMEQPNLYSLIIFVFDLKLSDLLPLLQLLPVA